VKFIIDIVRAGKVTLEGVEFDAWAGRLTLPSKQVYKGMYGSPKDAIKSMFKVLNDKV